MIVEPRDSTSAEPSDFEKDRVAWNLPGPKTSPAAATRRVDLAPERSDDPEGERDVGLDVFDPA